MEKKEWEKRINNWIKIYYVDKDIENPCELPTPKGSWLPPSQIQLMLTSPEALPEVPSVPVLLSFVSAMQTF